MRPKRPGHVTRLALRRGPTLPIAAAPLLPFVPPGARGGTIPTSPSSVRHLETAFRLASLVADVAR